MNLLLCAFTDKQNILDIRCLHINVYQKFPSCSHWAGLKHKYPSDISLDVYVALQT